MRNKERVIPAKAGIQDMLLSLKNILLVDIFKKIECKKIL